MPALDPQPNQMGSFNIGGQWVFRFNCGGCGGLLTHNSSDRWAAEANFATHIQIHTGPANIEWGADGFCQAVRV